jgi:hypothetical protein
MESGNVDQIFDEIRQLRVQYESEVGRARKAWPKSIRERVLRLAMAGIRYKVIAERSGISGNTIYSWTTRQGEDSRAKLPSPSSFIELPVAAANPIQRRYRKGVHEKSTTVTVKIGDRIEVSGLLVSEALTFVLGLGI